MNDSTEPKQLRKTFRQDLTSLINEHSLEQHCNTPDYILADYLINCFNNYCNIKNDNDVHNEQVVSNEH